MTGVDLLCLDASALINVLGSGVSGEILSATGSKVVATKQVFREVKRCPFDMERNQGPLIPLCNGGFLEVVELDDVELEIFLSLVGARPPNDLDDGEASSIAYGVSRGAAVVIDERKGRRICRERFGNLRVLCSLDLFRLYFERCGDVEKFRNALMKATRRARMSIPASCKSWVNNVLAGGIPVGVEGDSASLDVGL